MCTASNHHSLSTVCPPSFPPKIKEQEIAQLRSDGTGSSDMVEQAELEKDLLEDKLAKYESLNADLKSELKVSVLT